MKWVYLALFILSSATTAQAGLIDRLLRRNPSAPTPARAAANNAADLCKSHYEVVGRSAPRRDRRLSQIISARDVVAALQDHINDRKEAEATGNGVFPSQRTAPSPIERLPDGIRWHFRSAAGNQFVKPEDYDTVQRRLDRIAEILEGGNGNEDQVKATVGYVDDAQTILDLLQTKRRVPNVDIDRRRMLGTIGTTTAGLLLGIVPNLGLSMSQGSTQNAALNKIVNGVKDAYPGSLERHLQILRDALKSRRNPPSDAQIDQMIADHLKWIRWQEKLGVTFSYGARLHAYESIRNDNGNPLPRMEELAKRDPKAFSAEILEDLAKGTSSTSYRYGYGSSSRDEDGPFTPSEVAAARAAIPRDNIVERGRWPIAILIGGGLGFWSGQMDVDSKGAKWFSDLMVTRIPHPDLKEVEDLVKEALKPGPADDKRPRSEYVWLGANLVEDHTDFILHVDRTVNPPRVKLLALKYNTGVDYLNAPPPPKPESKVKEEPLPAATVALAKLQDHLEITKFPTLIEELAPLKDIMKRAKKMELKPDELKLVIDAGNKIEKAEDISKLTDLLNLIQLRRGG